MPETPGPGQPRPAKAAAAPSPDRSGAGEVALTGHGSTSVEMTSVPEDRPVVFGRRPDSSVHTGETVMTWRPDSTDPTGTPMVILDPSRPSAADNAPCATPNRCRIGMDLGKYHITGVLGEGGMGVVYEAEDTSLRRQVAIKLLPEFLSTKPEMLQRFLMEAQSAGKLDHPNVVGVYEVDRREGIHFIAMQFIRGGSAADLLKAKGPLPWPEATRILADATRGLAAAHEAGLIHRDIKPANIMLSADGPAKLADFGLAKWTDRVGDSLTGHDRVVGTPAYMSPEQCRAQAVDARSDVYSMGAAYFALLTGNHPYADAGATPEVMYAHCYNPVPDPTTVKPDLPAACAGVIRKAMAKAPADRHQTARELLAELEALVRPGSTEILPAALPACEQPQRLRRGLIINGVLFLMASALLLAEVFGLTNLHGLWGRADVLPPAAPAASADGVLVLDVNDPDIRVGVDRDEGLTAPGVGTHEHKLKAGRHLVTAEKAGIAVMREWIEVAAGAPQTVKIDGLRWVTACETLNGAGGPVWSAAFLSDRRQLATAIDDGTIKVWDPAEGKVTATLRGHTGPVWAVACSPDGKTLATGSDDGTVKLWSAADGKEGSVLRHGAPVRTLAFSADGARLATGCRDGTVRVWDVAAGTAVFVVPGHTGVVMSVAFSRDGKTVASGGWGGAVMLSDADSGNKRADLTGGHSQDVWTVGFSPDGRTLATAGEDRRVLLWDAAAGTVKKTLIGHTGTIYSVAFTADGNILASAGRDGTAKLWWAGDGPKPERKK